MSTKKKPTKREMFAQILSHTTNEAERKFIEHEMELLAKKNASTGEKKLTPNQVANEEVKSAIVEFLTAKGEPMTITMMTKEIPACNGMTNQKVSALVRQLVDTFVVVRNEVKGVAWFSIA